MPCLSIGPKWFKMRKHLLKICFYKIKPVNTKCTIIFLTKSTSTCLFTTGPICIDFCKGNKKAFTYVSEILNCLNKKRKSYINAKKDNAWEYIIIN